MAAAAYILLTLFLMALTGLCGYAMGWCEGRDEERKNAATTEQE